MKKLIAIVLTLVLALSFAACAQPEAAPAETAAPETTESAAPAELVKVKVGASVTPHAEILNAVKDELKAAGYDLEVVEFTDYVLPNTALEQGDLDANYFQHTPYLDNFNEENGTHLVSVGKIHYEPFGIYAGKTSDLSAIPEGGSIAIPNDGTNEARALLLLEAQGLIKLKEGIAFTARLTVPAQNENLDDRALCVVFANLLENGVEACGRMAGGEKFIRLNSSLEYGVLTVTMDNSFDGQARQEDGKFLSSKRRGAPGVGLSSIRAVAACFWAATTSII